MPLPDDLKVDWSKVSNGVQLQAEETAFNTVLKNIRPFKGTRVMPVNYSGETSLFTGQSRETLKSISVDKVISKPTSNGGLQVNFGA
ncbi:hypothetical protein ABTP36_19260, partial [Acinetobacter baumannii]